MRRTWTSPLRESKQRKDIAISERTRSLFDYKAAFNSSVEQVRSEGRYRVFADLKRVRGQFPQAVRRREDGTEQDVVIWCSNDYLGMSMHPNTVNAMVETAQRMGVGAAGGGIANEDCVLFMWATFPMLREALDVIEAWGFSYKTVAFNWVKQNRNGTGIFMGLGNWTRSNSEICLLATKGKPKRISGSVRSIVLSPLQQHSRKPAEIRDRIVELMGDLPRIELFAREAAPGWDVWGNEAPTPEVKDAPADSVELAGKEETHEPDNQRDPAPQL